MKSAKFNLVKVAGEVALIVIAVFVAVSLESMWQEHSDAADARATLAQLLQELRADNAFMQTVLAEQEMTGGLHSDLLNWFAHPESLPSDSVHETLKILVDTGLTMWPRRAAWTAMIETGQLSLLNDGELVAHLGDHFEHKQQRLKYIGEAYDAEKFYFEGRLLPNIWDWQRKRLLTKDSARIAEFHNYIYNLSIWNRWYLDYLVNVYEKDLSALTYEVDQYLSAHGDSVE